MNGGQLMNVFILTIILITIYLCVTLSTEFYFKIKHEYKKMEIGDVYIKKFDDPWKDPDEITIIDKKNYWVRVINKSTNEVTSMPLSDLLNKGYKKIKQ